MRSYTLCVAVVCLLAARGADGAFIDDMKSWMNEKGQTIASAFQKGYRSSSEEMKKYFEKVSLKVQTMFRGMDFKNMTVSEADEMPMDILEQLPAGGIKTMTKEVIERIGDRFRKNGTPEMLKAYYMKVLYWDKATPEFLITEARKTASQDNEANRMTFEAVRDVLLTKFGASEGWGKDLGLLLRDCELLSIPAEKLVRIEDKVLMERVLQALMNIIGGSPQICPLLDDVAFQERGMLIPQFVFATKIPGMTLKDISDSDFNQYVQKFAKYYMATNLAELPNPKSYFLVQGSSPGNFDFDGAIGILNSMTMFWKNAPSSDEAVRTITREETMFIASICGQSLESVRSRDERGNFVNAAARIIQRVYNSQNPISFGSVRENWINLVKSCQTKTWILTALASTSPMGSTAEQILAAHQGHLYYLPIRQLLGLRDLLIASDNDLPAAVKGQDLDMSKGKAMARLGYQWLNRRFPGQGLSNLPSEVIPFLDPSIFLNASSQDLVQVVNFDETIVKKMSDSSLTALVATMQPSLTTLRVRNDNMPWITSFLSIKDLDNTDMVYMRSYTQYLSPMSPLQQYYMERLLDQKRLTVTDVIDWPELFPVLSKAKVGTLMSDSLLPLLKALRLSEQYVSKLVARELCMQLKNYVMNITGEQMDMKDYSKVFSTSMIKRLSSQVLMEFPLNALMSLSDDQKIELVKGFRYIPLEGYVLMGPVKRRSLITSYFKALGVYRGPLKYPEVMALGFGCLDLTEDEFGRMTKLAFEHCCKKLSNNNLITRGDVLQPTLNNYLRDAFGRSVISRYGNPREWSSSTMYLMCPILHAVPIRFYADFPSGLIGLCAKEARPSPASRYPNMAMEQLGKIDLGDSWADFDHARMEVAMRKSQAALDNYMVATNLIPKLANRRKRETFSAENPLSCQKILEVDQAGGKIGNAFIYLHFEQMSLIEVLMCLPSLGASELDTRQAEVIFNKIQTYHDNMTNKIPESDTSNFGSVVVGIPPDALAQLSLTSYQAVFPFGVHGHKLTVDQGKEVVFAIMKTFKGIKGEELVPTSAFSGLEVSMLRNLLCHYTKTELSKLKAESVAKALPALRSLKKCSLQHLGVLLRKAKDFIGPITTWTRSIVNEMGVLIAGMTPTEMASLPIGAFEGISFEAAAAMSNETLQSISELQISYMDPLTLASIPRELRDTLPYKSREAVTKQLEGFSVYDSSSNQLAVRVTLMIPAVVLVTLHLLT